MLTTKEGYYIFPNIWHTAIHYIRDWMLGLSQLSRYAKHNNTLVPIQYVSFHHEFTWTINNIKKTWVQQGIVNHQQLIYKLVFKIIIIQFFNVEFVCFLTKNVYNDAYYIETIVDWQANYMHYLRNCNLLFQVNTLVLS